MPSPQPPGPKGKLIGGNAPVFRTDPLGFIARTARDYGDVAYIRSLPGIHSYLISHPDDVQDVLVRRAYSFEKPSIFKRVFEALFGNGLFFSEGDFHKRQRKLAQPAFHHKRIEAYAEEMVALTEKLLRQWESGGAREVDRDMTDLTLDVVVSTIFHTDITSDTERIREAMWAAGEATGRLSVSPVKAALPAWFPLEENRMRARSVAVLDEIIYRLIRERRESGADTGDLLSMLLLSIDEETGERMSDQQVRDEVLTLFIAGHETTAKTLTWALITLALRPDIEARLHAELDAALGGRAPTLADLPNLPTTEQIVKETLRYYPPVFVMFRTPVVDGITLGGYPIPKDGILWISPHGLHRDPRWWDDPDEFRPERWTTPPSPDPFPHRGGKENPPSSQEERGPGGEVPGHKMAYLPFGGGPRVCLGNGFAMLEARLLLATIAGRYRVVLAPGQEIVVGNGPLLAPEPPVRMVVTERERVAAIA